MQGPSRLRAGSLAVAALMLLTSCSVVTAGRGVEASSPTGAPNLSAGSVHVIGDMVGPLFLHGTSQPHGCTATVVASRSGSVVMTAAHCLSGTAVGTQFVPGYAHGRRPFGVWTVTAAYVPAGWEMTQNTADDVAFLRLAPGAVDGTSTSVQQATGAVRLGSAPAAPGQTITVRAYDVGIDDQPVQCTTSVYATGGDPSFDCPGFSAGSSGAAWLVRSGDGWDAVGLIGGRHQGGCDESTSYSPTFGTDIGQTLAEADRGAPPDTVPSPPADGC